MKKYILFVILFLFFGIFAIAANASTLSRTEIYYKTNSGYSDSIINLNNDTLNAAKDSAIVQNKKFNFTARIEMSYDIHIYHFESPESGYYAFYTFGTLDTAIKVYEHENIMWWTTSYKDLGSGDDNSMADNNRFNASLAIKLNKGEDYYICVRGYEDFRGEYTLVVEPNEDKMLRPIYNHSYWKCEYLSNSSAMVGVYTKSKQYLTQDEVLLFYWSLDPACQEYAGYDIDYLYNSYNQNKQNAIDIANIIVGLITEFIDSSHIVNISLSALGMIFSYAYEQTNTEPYEMMQFLNEECGVIYNDNGWSSQHGLCIEEWVNADDIYLVSYNYYIYNEDILVGEKYESGSWKN